MKTRIPLPTILLLALPATLAAQENAQPGATFENAASDVQRQLEESLAELAEVRQGMAAEQVPLTRELNALESRLVELRGEYQQKSRLLDSRTLDLNNLKNEIKSREEESGYLGNLLSEYQRNFESRLHIAEVQRYAERLSHARLAHEDPTLTQGDLFTAEADVLSASLDRLFEALGGTRFEGSAVDPGGVVRKGSFVLVGPSALFATADGSVVGTAEQRLGSLEPSVIPFDDPADAGAARELVAGTGTRFPFDPTLGNAHKIEQTHETFVEHAKKGGPVMIAIFALAGSALLVALVKWLSLSFVRTPSRKQQARVLAAVAAGERETALREARAMRGPGGAMLAAGCEHLDEPRELIEEVMYETVLTTRLRLQRFLPFIAITSSSAPLLGLLGTVTGIMNTFTLMTVFGTGDVKTLSSGISEALITTEFGLYVAIPSLLLYAFLSRKAKGVIDGMEKSAVAFLNHVGRMPAPPAPPVEPAPVLPQREITRAAAPRAVAVD